MEEGTPAELSFAPLIPDRWADLEKLFGPRGGVGGCWCMYWRLSHSDFERGKGEENRRAMKKVVDSGPAPGVLAYSGGEPVGWCAVAPRSEFLRLRTSRILKPVDDQAVWSIVCLFVAKGHRRTGLSGRLIRAAAEHAAALGAKIVEAYPVVPRKDRMPDAFAWTGIASAFEKAGFQEVARRSPNRPFLRWTPPTETGGA